MGISDEARVAPPSIALDVRRLGDRGPALDVAREDARELLRARSRRVDAEADSRSRTSGSRTARTTSSFSRFTIGAGVAAGTKIPIQSPTSTSGTPASAIVGTSG